MNLERLRRETSAEHLAVEGSLPLMSATLTVETYVRCLERMYGMVAGWEETAAATAPEWLREMVVARRRRHLLESDLGWFGIAESEIWQHVERPGLPDLCEVPEFLGAMYVMEGSTLGGQLIARHVEAVLLLETGRGSAFFRGHGAETGALWKEFCQVLRTRVAEDDAERVIGAAQQMFRAFGEWMGRIDERADERADEARVWAPGRRERDRLTPGSA